MLSDKVKELYQSGEIGEAITRYRYALRFENDAFERAKIYLDLARIYRIRVRMKNAHLELRRAFETLQLLWPENTWRSVLHSCLTQNSWPKVHPDFERRPLDSKTQMLVELYEEVGLSAYYLRQNWTLVQTMIRGKKPCFDLGPSMPLLNWYGGSSCILALMDLTLQSLIKVKRVEFLYKKSMQFIHRCYEIAAQLHPHTGMGKALIWEALLCEYHGDPVRSAELFERCLNEHGKYLDPFDIRLSAITLCVNYLSRGHFKKSLEAMKKQEECNSSFQEAFGGMSMDDVPWYSLGAKAMLGEIKEIQKPVRLFSSILSADKDEKWLLAHYLGQLLIAGRQTGLNVSQAEDLISRFEVLGMSPRGTHSETGFYWVAEAYMRFSFAVQDRHLIYKFKRSLKRLGQVLPHPTTHSHYAVLKAGLAWLEGKTTVYENWYRRALEEARQIDNQWALLELDHLRLLALPREVLGFLKPTELIFEKARELYQRGEIQEAITRYRHALRYENDAFEKTSIYIDLARLYRIRVRMKNVRLELQRACEALLLPWPENTLRAVLHAYLNQNTRPQLHPDFERRPEDRKTQMLVDLYEEIGMSGYYLRQSWTVIQTTFRTRKACHDLGPSIPLVNWYGGTACILGIIELYLQSVFHVKRIGFLYKKSQHFIRKGYEIAAHLGPHRGFGRATIWEGQLCELHGQPVRAAELYQRCLQEHGSYLDPFDIRAVSIGLSINYLSRGHFQKSIEVLKTQGTYNPALQEATEIMSLDDVPWYALGPKAMLGETKDIQKAVHSFRSLLSVDKDEKWLLAQFLGQLLIAGRQTGLNVSQAEDLISRFEMLGMTPQGTHTETGFYWVAEAYTRFSFAVQDRHLIYKFKRSLKRLGQVLPYPTTHSHYAVLKAGLAWLEGQSTVYERWYRRAFEEARQIDNQWALLELDHLRLLVSPPGAAGGPLEIK